RTAFDGIPFQKFLDPDDTDADPDGKGIAGPGEGIVTFAWLIAGLVQINDDGETGKEEQEEGYHEVAFVAVGLHKETDESQDHGQQEHPVIGLIVLMDGIRHTALIAEEDVVDKRNAGDGIAVTRVAKALEIILFPGEVPHKVTQEHLPVLIADKVF